MRELWVTVRYGCCSSLQLWEAYQLFFFFFFFILNSTNNLLLCRPDIVGDRKNKKEWEHVPKPVIGLLNLALVQSLSTTSKNAKRIWHPKESSSVRYETLVQMNVTWDFAKQDYYGPWTMCSLTFWDWLDQICHGKVSLLRASIILKTRLHK